MARYFRLIQAVMSSSLLVLATAETLGCATSYSKLGCFVDHRRPLPLLLLNERDDINWQQWNEFLETFVCNCSNIAAASGFSYFGIQFWGECWAEENPDDVTYDADGQSDKCVGRDLLPCEAASTNCAGVESVNYVYNINLKDKLPNTCEDVNPSRCQEFSKYCEKYLNVQEACPVTCNTC